MKESTVILYKEKYGCHLLNDERLNAEATAHCTFSRTAASVPTCKGQRVACSRLYLRLNLCTETEEDIVVHDIAMLCTGVLSFRDNEKMGYRLTRQSQTPSLFFYTNERTRINDLVFLRICVLVVSYLAK